MLQALPILVSLLTQAAAPPATGAEAPPKERAQALLKEGSALYKQADFAAALQKFSAAYAIYPSPKLQFNIAQADRELGRTVEAVEAFETFLVQAPDSPPELIAEARQSLAEMKPKLAQVRVDALGGAQVTVDNRSIGVTPIARIIWVTPGRHRVTVNHPSYLSSSLEVTVAVGEIRTVSPKLSRVAEAPPSPAPAVAPPAVALTQPSTPAPTENIVSAAPPASTKAGGLAQRPWYFWTAAAATGAFAVGAIVAGVAANGRYSDLENGCGMTSGCSESQIDTVKTRARLANVLWILAGASAVATGVTFYIDSRESTVSVALKF
jgi:outer membrane protein assembly factor BamD (BamD/ComL family)